MNSAEVREKETPKERKIGQRRRSEGKGYSRADQVKGKDEAKHESGRAWSIKEHDRSRRNRAERRAESKSLQSRTRGTTLSWALRSFSMGVATKFERGGHRLKVRRVRGPSEIWEGRHHRANVKII